MNKLARISLFVLAVVLTCAAVNAAALNAPGFRTTDIEVTLAPGGFVGGFDVLPNGHFIINDGQTVREISQAGQADQVLYTFESPVYGSFVRYNAADGKIYFGESSTGAISKFTYSNPADVSLVTTIANNFDMDFRNGQPYVVASDSGWSNSKIYLIGGSSDDLIASCIGPSGPMAFTSAGDLIYIPASYDITTQILMWKSAQIAGAIGPTSLTWASAEPLHLIEAGYGAALDSAGRLLFTNNSVGPAAIQLYDGNAVNTFATFAQPGGTSPFISIVRQNATTGEYSAVVSYWDAGVSHTVISTMTPVPEPSSLLALCSLIGLVGSAGLLRRSRK